MFILKPKMTSHCTTQRKSVCSPHLEKKKIILAFSSLNTPVLTSRRITEILICSFILLNLHFFHQRLTIMDRVGFDDEWCPKKTESNYDTPDFCFNSTRQC